MKPFLLLFCIALASLSAAQDLLYGRGDATFYYDINGGGTCGPANGITSYPSVQSYPLCETNSPDPKQLIDYDTNNIVAIPSSLLFSNLDTYCGKKIVVTVNGVERDDLSLVVWDGCAACNRNDGLGFSSTVFADLFGEDRCGDERIQGEMSWRIVDEQVIPYGDQNQENIFDQKDEDGEVSIDVELEVEEEEEEDDLLISQPPSEVEVEVDVDVEVGVENEDEEEEEVLIILQPPPVEVEEEEEYQYPVVEEEEEEEGVGYPSYEEEEVVKVYPPPVEEESVIVYPTPEEEKPLIPVYPPSEEEEPVILYPPQEEETVIIIYPPQEEETIILYPPPQEEETVIILYPPQEEETVIILYPPPEEEVTYNPGGVLYNVEPEEEEEEHKIYPGQNW